MQGYLHATMYTDRHTGRQYLVRNGYSSRVVQYRAGVEVYFDGSCAAGGKLGETCFKTRANLNSWLRMMGFKK